MNNKTKKIVRGNSFRLRVAVTGITLSEGFERDQRRLDFFPLIKDKDYNVIHDPVSGGQTLSNARTTYILLPELVTELVAQLLHTSSGSDLQKLKEGLGVQNLSSNMLSLEEVLDALRTQILQRLEAIEQRLAAMEDR